MRLRNFQPGDWFQMKYGFDQQVFYVLWATPEEVCFTKTNWLVSSAMQWPVEKLDKYKPVYLGHTKRRWWVFWTPELVCPFKRLRIDRLKPPSVTQPPIEAPEPTEEWPEYITGSWK